MKRILFIGNSFTYFNHMPDMVQAMADTAGIPAEIRTLAYGGFKLMFYTDPEHTHGTEALPLIASEPWDAVVLQEQSITPAIARDLFHKGTEGLVPAIRAAGAEPVFYATWPYRDHSPKLDATGLDYPEMLRLLTEGYRAEAEYWKADAVWVGEPFVRFQEVNPTFSLYMPDHFHPNAAGSYLAACLFFRYFFEADPPAAYCPEDLSPTFAEKIREFLRS